MKPETDIFLNQIAQEVVTIEQGLQWFKNLQEDQQREIFRDLVFIICQAKAKPVDAENAVARSGLSPTFTPCVLLFKAMKEQPYASSVLEQALWKIMGLPENEREKSFRLFIALFQVADARRRERNFDPERHWWHRDLSDEQVVADLLAGKE